MTVSADRSVVTSRFLFAPLLSVLMMGGPVSCGGGGSDEGSGGSSGSSGTGGSAGSSGSSGSGGSNSGSGGSAGSSGTGGNAEPSGEVCPNADRAGSFALRLSGNRTLLSGAISDGVAPTGVHRVVRSEGACELLGPRDLFCATACGSGMTCAGDDMCVPTPMKQSAGTVTVTGLLTPLEASANGITGEYNATISNPYPAFDAGSAIELSAAGGVVPAFKLHGWGVPELVTSLSTVNVVSGSPVALTWDATGVNTDHSEIFINFSVNVHGAITGWIECTVPDTGSFDLPASLVSDLIDLGLSGFPRMTMTRRSADATELSTGNCVDFEVGSQVTIELTVDGLVSCNDDTDCPDGQSCTPELSCE